MRRMVLGLTALVFAALGAAAIFLALKAPEGPVSPAAIDVAGSDIGGPFTLTDQTGKRVTSAEIIDGPTLIYFGYTYCPDVCPVDVAIMASVTEMLAERGIEVTPVFITIDPARDTPESLAYYVEAMHPGMIGLTGSAEEIKAAADAYNVYYRRVDAEDSAAGYLMDHTTFTYFVTPDGVEAVFRRGYPPEEIAGAVEKLVSRG